MKHKTPFNKLYPERIKRISKEELEEELLSINQIMRINVERAKGQQQPIRRTKTNRSMKELRHMKLCVFIEMKERKKNVRKNNY